MARSHVQKRILKLTRIPMEVQAQNTWKETIEKEAMARLNFQIPEWEDEDAWFDRTKYRPRGQPIILQSPGLSNPDFVPDPETLVQKPDEIEMKYRQTFESSVMQPDVKVVKF